MNEQIVTISNTLRAHLSEERMIHTYGVMYTAAALAMRYHTNVESAMLAGILHDCAKSVSDQEKVNLCKEYGLTITPIEQENPGLLHAKLGAAFAEDIYGITDPEVLDSIIYHTTGRPGMTFLDKIIYIADYIEPGRCKLPNIEIVRQLAFSDIDECLYQILSDSLDYLQSSGRPIDPMTEETYHYYKKQLGK